MFTLLTTLSSGQQVWSFNGVFEFGTPDLSQLNVGDLVQEHVSPETLDERRHHDSRYNPRQMYVNFCSTCGEKFLHTTAILVPVECSNCYSKKDSHLYTYDDIFPLVKQRFPDLSEQTLNELVLFLIPLMNQPKGKI